MAQSQRPSTSSQVSSALPCMPGSASAALGQHAATSCDCDSQDTRAIAVWVASGRHYVAKQRVVADGRLLPVWLQCAANVLVSTSTAELAQDIHAHVHGRACNRCRLQQLTRGAPMQIIPHPGESRACRAGVSSGGRVGHGGQSHPDAPLLIAASRASWPRAAHSRCTTHTLNCYAGADEGLRGRCAALGRPVGSWDRWSSEQARRQTRWRATSTAALSRASH